MDAETRLIRQLRARRTRAVAEAQELLATSEAAGRSNLTAEEETRFTELQGEIAQLDERIQELTERRDRTAAAAASARKVINARPFRGDGADVDPDTVVLTREQHVSEWAEARGRNLGPSDDGRELSFGRYIRGIVTGDWSDAEAERRAMSEGVLGSGGYLVPTPLSADVIDRARNRTRVLQAGALTVPMESQTLKIARVAGDPTAAWHSEGEVIADSDVTLESVTLTAHTLTALVKASRELVEDARNVEGLLEDLFAESLAVEVDRAALRGSGVAPEPTGILNTSGITVFTLGAGNGATPTWDDVVDRVLGPIEDNNFDLTGIIWAPRTSRTLAKAKDTQQRYLDPPTPLREVPRFATNQVPINLTVGTSNDCSEIYGAQWPELLIGMRVELEVSILREKYADTGELGFLAWLRVDVQLARPKAFALVKGVRP